MIHNRRSMKKCFHKSHEKKCESQEVPEDFLKATELESSYSWVHHANPCKEKGGGRQKKQMLFIFHFISVTTDIQLNDSKTISKVPHEGNYKWVWNQLRLFAAYKVFGVLDPRKVSKSLGGETHRRDPYQALPPRLPVHLVPVVQATLSEQQNLQHFGYVAYTGSFVDLSKVLVSDAVPGLEVDSMTALSHRVDGGAKGWNALLTPEAKNLLRHRAYKLQPHLTSRSALQSLLNPTQALQVNQSRLQLCRLQQFTVYSSLQFTAVYSSCHHLPAGKLNGLESFIPEWSLLSNTSKHTAHAHRGLVGQPDKCACARTVKFIFWKKQTISINPYLN